MTVGGELGTRDPVTVTARCLDLGQGAGSGSDGDVLDARHPVDPVGRGERHAGLGAVVGEIDPGLPVVGEGTDAVAVVDAGRVVGGSGVGLADAHTPDEGVADLL